MKNKFKFLSVLLALTTCFILFCFVGCETNNETNENDKTQTEETPPTINLQGKDRNAYEILLDFSSQFEKPETLRIDSGLLLYDVNFIFSLHVSFENTTNNTKAGFYQLLGSDNKIEVTLDLLELSLSDNSQTSTSALLSMADAMTEDDIDCNAINSALDQYWGTK